jgi:LPXTG-motif cell wall-anchored protein
VNAFRVLALAYALVALMIAPGWLSADEQVPPAPAAAPDEQVAPATEPAPVVADDPPADAPASDPEVTVAEEPAEPTAVEETAVAEDDEAKPKPRPVAKAAASGSVTITDFEFSPSTITVNEGDTVTWTNQGPTPHTATAEDGSFDTGNLNKGQSGSATFTAAGTISYICTPHPFMTGKVIVQAAAAGDDDSGSTDDGGDDDDITAGSETAGESDTADDGSGLPNTGAETLIIALLGIATLGAGVLLRRRAT